MNGRKAYKQIKSWNRYGFNLGHTFINDMKQYASAQDYMDDLIDTADKTAHFDQFDSWYLPFDVCTTISIFDPEIVPSGKGRICSVTLIDNPEHKLTSPIEFKYIMNKEAAITGAFQLVVKEEYDKITEKQHQDNCDEFDVVTSYNYNFDSTADDGGLEKYLIVFYFRNLKSISRDSGNVVSIPIDEKVRKAGKGSGPTSWEGIAATCAQNVVQVFNYFTKLHTDTKLFVVEEQSAAKKKGKIKKKMGTPSLFHIMDIKTIRKHIVKRKDAGSSESIVRGPTERRRHTRTYRHDRYVNMKGQTVIIEPIWIGPSTSHNPDNNKLYKVRLDIG